MKKKILKIFTTLIMLMVLSVLSFIENIDVKEGFDTNKLIFSFLGIFFTVSLKYFVMPLIAEYINNRKLNETSDNKDEA